MGQVDPFPELTELFCWIHNPVRIYLTRSYRVLVKPFCLYTFLSLVGHFGGHEVLRVEFE